MDLLKHGLQVDYVVLGGGETRKLKKVPKGARLGSNSNAFLGGCRLWEDPRKRHLRLRVAPSEPPPPAEP